jgi:serralysin
MIDGLAYGQWNFSGRKIMTFSFPTSGAFYDGGANTYAGSLNTSSFTAANNTQKDCLRYWFFVYSTFLPIEFQEMTETSSDHADIRIAGSANVSQAATFLPYDPLFESQHTDGEAGDLWFRFDGGFNLLTPTNPGLYGHQAYGHELGHSLGLKHPHESLTNNTNTIAAANESLRNTIMSYRDFPSDSTDSIRTSDLCQTPMVLDFRALQFIYGANYSLDGDTVITFSPTTGARSFNGVEFPGGIPSTNKVFCCLWMPGGADRLDLSNYSPGEPTIDLTNGGFSITKSAQQVNDGGGGTKPCAWNAYDYQSDPSSRIESSTSP